MYRLNNKNYKKKIIFFIKRNNTLSNFYGKKKNINFIGFKPKKKKKKLK